MTGNDDKLAVDRCGRNAGYPTPPAQIPASPLGHGAPTSGI